MSLDDKKPASTIAQLVEREAKSSGNSAPQANTVSALQKPAVKKPEARLKAEAPEIKTPEIKTAETNKRKVDLLKRLKGLDMLVPGSNLERELIDDYRRIKRPLVSNAVGKNKSLVERGNIILVTSSLPGEGKTFTSVNLALSIAQEMDTTVLLVDCDVAKHGVSRVLGIEKLSGLVDVLVDKNVTVGDVMLQTDIPTLTVMSAGKQHEYVTELLASERMAALVDEIANRYSDRVVIFDGPPMLPTPQTQVLAGLVGQVVFVIETGKTPQSLVLEALELMPEEQAVGLVLNKNEGVSGRGGYYYGYYGPADD